MFVYFLALLSILLGAVAQLLLKMSVSGKESLMTVKGFMDLCCDFHFLGGIICYGLSLIVWLKVLSELELSKAYPMVSLGYVFAFILGWLVLGEDVRIMRILGLAFIIFGVIIISRN